MKNDCPNLAVKKAHDATKPHSSTNSQSGGRSHPAHTPAALWKAMAPAPGNPETKTVGKKPGMVCQMWLLVSFSWNHNPF